MFTSCVCDIQGYVYIYIQRERENKMYSCRSTSACARTFQTSQSLLNAAFNHFWLYVPITFESLSFSKSLLKHFKITFGYISRITCKSRLNQKKMLLFRFLLFQKLFSMYVLPHKCRLKFEALTVFLAGFTHPDARNGTADGGWRGYTGGCEVDR